MLIELKLALNTFSFNDGFRWEMWTEKAAGNNDQYEAQWQMVRVQWTHKQ